VDFKQFMTVIREIQRFWISTNELPADEPAGGKREPPQLAATVPAPIRRAA
jgi:hypothetical protein